MNAKFYCKILDLIQKDSVGCSVGSSCQVLLGCNQQLEDGVYDQIKDSKDEGQGRLELSNFFDSSNSSFDSVTTSE